MSTQTGIIYHTLDEVQDRIDHVANMTADELINHIILGKFTISDCVHPDDVQLLMLPTLQNWQIKIMPPTESRNTSIVMITPLDHPSRQIWMQGQITIGLLAGLNYENAVLWAKSNNRSKHRWLRLVVRCLSRPKLVMAYEEYYNNRSNPNFDFEEWSRENDIQERMPSARRIAFVLFLRECAGSRQK